MIVVLFLLSQLEIIKEFRATKSVGDAKHAVRESESISLISLLSAIKLQLVTLLDYAVLPHHSLFQNIKYFQFLREL